MTQHLLHDTYQIDGAAKVRVLDGSGYVVAYPRVARTGIQLYLGSEVGMKDRDVVRVYRPESAVFDKKALASMTHKPVTDDHPPELVTADNWKKYGKGNSESEVARDGEFVRVPLMLSDGGLIKKFQNGKKEISVGYTCSLDFTPGTTPNGEAYDAVQGDINVNHIAIVDAARGGEKLRLGDGAGAPVDTSALATVVSAIQAGKVNKSDALALTDADSLSLGKDNQSYRFTKDGTVYASGLQAARVFAMAAKDTDVVSAIDALLSFIGDGVQPASPQPEKKTMTDKTIIVDGIGVSMPAQTADIVARALSTQADAFEKFKKEAKAKEEENETKVKSKDAEIATLSTAKATADAEIATLKKQLADSALTPAMLDAAVTSRQHTTGVAKAMLSTVVVDGKTEVEIKRQVVDHALGDAAKGWTDEQVAISFATLAKDVKPAQAATSVIADMSTAFAGGAQHQPGSVQFDSAKFHADRNAKLENRYKTAGAPAA